VLDLRRRILSELRAARWIDPLSHSPERRPCGHEEEAEEEEAAADLCARATAPPAMTGPGGPDPHDWPIFDAVGPAGPGEPDKEAAAGAARCRHMVMAGQAGDAGQGQAPTQWAKGGT
jgi:hypothetical protein